MVRLQTSERGALNALLIPLVLVSLLFVLSIVFGIFAYTSMQDYKQNSDDKVATAVQTAVQKEDAKKAADFAEEQKKDTKTYSGPAAYGSIQVQYPKIWSAYVIEPSNENGTLDAYFNPNFVPSTVSQTNSFALRVKVINQSYASVLQTLQGSIKAGKLTATPFAFPKVPTAVGTKLSGDIQPSKPGTMVVMPLRANTLEVWTDGNASLPDFEKYILPNLSFAP
jgi:cytoskeletal protein RodZ